MHITMVTRIMPGGSPCRKCGEARQYLASKGYWDRIDEVVEADIADPESPGLKLASQHGVELAPFFIVRDGDTETVYTSVVALVRTMLASSP